MTCNEWAVIHILSETNLKFQQPALLEVPKFKTALEYRDRFSFGIDKLDSKLQLNLDDMTGIFGETRYTNALATRLVVRSLLPRNHGGIEAYQDPYIRTAEVKSLVSQIVTALHKIKDVFIILTSRFTDNQIEFPAMSRIEIRAKKEFDEAKLNLSIYNNGRLKKVSMAEAELRID